MWIEGTEKDSEVQKKQITPAGVFQSLFHWSFCTLGTGEMRPISFWMRCQKIC